MPVMHPGRVDVIGAGSLILGVLMDEFGFAEVVVSEHDILDGIALRLARGLRNGRVAVDDGGSRSPGRARGGPSPRGRLRDLAALDAADLRVPRLPAAGRLARGGRRVKRASFRVEDYWGRPVPGSGRPTPAIAIVGLAPAAHGGNRTGRVFTGDRSGDWIFAALLAGGAGQPADLDARRGRAGADRRAGGRGGALRAAGQRADAGGAGHLLARGWPGSWPCCRGCG